MCVYVSDFSSIACFISQMLALMEKVWVLRSVGVMGEQKHLILRSYLIPPPHFFHNHGGSFIQNLCPLQTVKQGGVGCVCVF